MKAMDILKELKKDNGNDLVWSKDLTDRKVTEALEELEAYKAKIYELLQYNSSQMCKKCADKDANDNLKALYCNSCFRNYVDNFEELDK